MVSEAANLAEPALPSEVTPDAHADILVATVSEQVDDSAAVEASSDPVAVLSTTDVPALSPEKANSCGTV